MTRVIINNDTEVTLNGIPVTLPRDTHVLFHVDSMAHVAELCSAGKLHIDLSHNDGGERVTYGAGGKEVRTPIVAIPEDEMRADGTPCNTYTEAEAKSHIGKTKKAVKQK